MLLKRIGERIKELRITNTQLNQEDFANKIGLDKTYLSRVEAGKQNITILNLNQICNGLNVDFNIFFQPFNEMYIRGNDDE